MKYVNFSITEISGRTFEIPLDKAKEIIADIKENDKYFKNCEVNLDSTEEVVRFLYLYGLDNIHEYELANDYYETQLVDMNESEEYPMTTKSKLTYEEFENKLQGFYGTEEYHKVTLLPVLATDGVKFFAETCECFWLLDFMAIPLFTVQRQLGGLVINIEVNKRHTVHVTARGLDLDGIVFDKKVGDKRKLIPVGTYKMYFMEGILLLPSEY